MKNCKNCGRHLLVQITVQGRKRNLRNRTQCLICLPFGKSPYRKKSLDEMRSKNSLKNRKWMTKKRKEIGDDPIKLIRKNKKKQVIDALGGACFICKYNKCIRNLVFHHISDKSFSLDERGFQRSWKNILLELKKCVVLCHNCHGEIHAGLIDTDTIKSMNVESNKILENLIVYNLTIAKLIPIQVL